MECGYDVDLPVGVVGHALVAGESEGLPELTGDRTPHFVGQTLWCWLSGCPVLELAPGGVHGLVADFAVLSVE